MAARSDIAIVSVFGRGHWLARQLVRDGMRVSLIDVSESFGASTGADWEGPFPVFRSLFLLPSQWEYLRESPGFQELPSGFSVWLQDGPLEFRGPLTNYRWQRLGINNEVSNYLREAETASEVKMVTRSNFLSRLTFEGSWPVHFSHQYASNVYRVHHEAKDYGRPAPLFAPTAVRIASDKDIDQGFQNLRLGGVEVVRATDIVDVAAQGSHLEGLELRGGHAGVLTARRFVWMLSAAETSRFAEKIVKPLFPVERPEAQWCWVRFRVEASKAPEVEVLPAFFTMIANLLFPWTHNNLLSVKRVHGSKTQLDCWIRIPARRRFHHSFLDEMADLILKEFRRRLSTVEFQVREMPLEGRFTFDELGAARYPVYVEEELKSVRTPKYKNIYLDGPDRWVSLDKVSILQRESKMAVNLLREIRIEREDELGPQPPREDRDDRPLHTP